MGLFSSLFGSGNKSAYDTSGLASAVGKSNDLYKSIYDQSMASSQPWTDLGGAAASQLGSFLGLTGDPSAQGYGSLTQPFNYNSFTADPSYQFLQDESQKAVERSAAARGSVYAPSTMTALQDRSQALASTEYGNAFNRDQASKTSLYDMLTGASNAGQTQAATNAQIGQNYADSISNNNIGLQNSILSAYQAKNANTQSMLGNWMNLGGQLGSAALLASDRRVKENIKRVGKANGFNLYHFNYRGGRKRYEGVMAQEVQETRPDAVADINGTLHVNYGAIGVQMREV
jgi:hypothetical protein